MGRMHPVAVVAAFGLCAISHASDPQTNGTATADSLARGVHRSVPVLEAKAASFGAGVASFAILSAAEPEIALAHSSILTTRLHGSVGEALVGSELHALGGWKSIPPRHGPQGLDHVWMKFDKAGRPVGLIVGETKFGTSRLGMTRSGRQMGAGWISKRLASLADDWDAMARDVAARHGAAKARPFRLRADYLRAASEGRVAYRSELFRVSVKGDVATISVRTLDANGFAVGKERVMLPIRLAGRPANIVKAELIGEVRKAYPLLGKEESRQLAQRLYSQAKSPAAAISAKNPTLRMVGTTGAVLAAGGLVAGGIDAAVQMMSEGKLDWLRTGKMAGLGAASAMSAEAAQLGVSMALMRNASFRSATIALGRSMRLLPARTVALAPKAVGGVAGALAFAYGGYALGLYDVEEAHKTAIAGAAGTAMGGLAYSGMMAAASAWGTASTGTAIATLHGAAAESASLAWFGGGAASAGGGGVAWGAAVVGGVVVIVAASMTAAVMYGIHLHDAAEDWRRVGNTAGVLRDHAGDYPGNPWARPNTSAFF